MGKIERLTALFDEWGLSQYIPHHTEREMLAAFLLARGVIVPPCKPGDILYQPLYGKILEYEVISWRVREEGLQVVTHSRQTGGLYHVWGAFIGETHFLTKAEAEKALATGKEQPCNQTLRQK